MHGRKLGLRRLGHEEIEALGLANERSPIARELNDALHRDLPRRAVEVAKLTGKFHKALDAAIIGHDG